MNKLELRQKEVRAHISAVVDQAFHKERFVKMAMMAYMKNPKLEKASWPLVLMELVRCARMGLVPDGNEAIITTFYDKKKNADIPQLMPMVWGLMKIVKQGEGVRSVMADLVCEKDVFNIKRDSLGATFEHVPHLKGDAGAVIGAYAVAYLADAPTDIEFMATGEINLVQSKSISGAWKSFWGEMAKKTVMRRLIKRLPKNPHLDEFVEVDNRNFGPIEEPTIEAPKEGDYKKKLQEAVTQDNAPFEVEGPDTMEGGHGRAMEEMLGGKQENRNRSEYDT